MNNLWKLLKNIRLPFSLSMQIVFDLGTTTTRIALKDKGIILKEPTCIGYNTKTQEAIFYGRDAKNVIGKTPEFIKINRPIIAGIISDFDAEVDMIKYYLDKSVSPYLHQSKIIKPKLHAIVSYPVIATEIEQKAAEEVLLKAGCSSVFMIPRPLATGAGCKLNIFSHQPHAIVSLGGGLIEISIISGGGIVGSKTLKNAGESMDKIIANYAYLKHGIILGEATCEKLKISLLNFKGEEKIILVRGKSLETGLPKSIKMNAGEIIEALHGNFNQIVESIKELIEISPPEIVDDIYEEGIFFTGELSNIPGVDDFFNKELKININLPENFADATIHGLRILGSKSENIEKLKSYRFF